VLFIDEVHRLQAGAGGDPLFALEDYKAGHHDRAGAISADAHDGCEAVHVYWSDDAALLSAPLRSRFGLLFGWSSIRHDDLRVIVESR